MTMIETILFPIKSDDDDAVKGDLFILLCPKSLLLLISKRFLGLLVFPSFVIIRNHVTGLIPHSHGAALNVINLSDSFQSYSDHLCTSLIFYLIYI